MAGLAGSALLEANQVEQFERDGFVVIDDACSPDLVDGVLQDIEPLLRDEWDTAARAERDGVVYFKHAAPTKGYFWHRLQAAWKQCPNVRALALSERFLSITEQLFGRAVKPFQTLNFPVGTEQPAHADSFHFQSDPPGFMCGIWVALEDMDMDNGPLVYYPGSHKIPMPTWELIEQATGTAHVRDDFDSDEALTQARHEQYVGYCQSLIEDHALKPSYGTIRKGQALIWAPNLLHGGSPQADRSRTRHSQVTHYFFEGCRVYTPMRVDQGHIYWDYPEWIRDPVPQYSAGTVHDAIREHVPGGSHVLIVNWDDEVLLDVDGYRAEQFPSGEDGGNYYSVAGEEAVRMLEARRAAGARFLVVPKPSLGWLQLAQPELQEWLETPDRGVLRDGSICAIYSLE
jgi:ectoine hydroxylase-related dioxygenase (phytanoyl-CoA dioxygenase family)